MIQSGLVFTTSPWFTLLCLAAGALYAWLLYQPAPPWGRAFNFLLAGLRATLVALICFLLLAPLVRTVQSTTEKAEIVLAIDNSESLSGLVSPSLKNALGKLTSQLASAGYRLSVQSLTGAEKQPDSIRYDRKTTDLSALLSTIRSNFEGQNLTDVILLSDGAINRGISPAHAVYPFRVHTIAVGDTIPKRDIQLRNVHANRVAFTGNKFPIQADIAAYGMAGTQANVVLKQGATLLETRRVTIRDNNYFESVSFATSSDKKGIRHYTIEVSPAAGETNPRNNRREVYIEVIDGKEKILLLALAPHPDLKALRSIIGQNENYELDLCVLTAGNPPETIYTKPYDLIILHQVPDIHGISTDVMNRLLARNTSLFFILGNQSSIPAFNPLNRNIQITASPNQFDKVAGRLNPAFRLLTLDTEKLTLLEKLPPLSVPYGEYRPAPGTETVLFQKLGNLNTGKPLLTVHTAGERKTGVLLGEGLWLWQLEEFSLHHHNEATTSLFSKLIQLLALKEDKRKFRVTPASPEFEEGEPVVFQTEVYNDIYEEIYGQQVTLSITDEAGRSQKLEYQHTETTPSYEVSGLKEGVYQYTATTMLGGKETSASGQFIVRDQDLERLNATADFGLLRELAAKSGGRFLFPETLPELTKLLETHRSPDRLNTTDELVELIHLKWLFFLLILLAASEWGLRKYLGGY